MIQHSFGRALYDSNVLISLWQRRMSDIRQFCTGNKEDHLITLLQGVALIVKGGNFHYENMYFLKNHRNVLARGNSLTWGWHIVFYMFWFCLKTLFVACSIHATIFKLVSVSCCSWGEMSNFSILIFGRFIDI